MISLMQWLKSNYMKDGNLTKSEAVMEMSADLKASYSTIYSWLNSNDYYVVLIGATNPEDDGSSVFVYKQVRAIHD